LVSDKAVSINIGASRSGEVPLRSLAANCTPLSPGIITSRTIKSNSRSRSRAVASAALRRR